MVANFYGVNPRSLQRQYKDYLSDFKLWNQKPHAEQWLLFPKNIGSYLSIDETAFSNGDLYTIVTNKNANGKKGALLAMIKGTKAEDVIRILHKIALKQRKKVIEVTLDMAGNMGLIVKKSFPKAVLVIDRFHVQKLALDALQEIRIKHRWEAIDKENDAIENAKNNSLKYVPELLPNGDTLKQLLARSRYLLYKSSNKWTNTQQERAEILFKNYPDIEKAYNLCQNLSWIYNQTKDKTVALIRLAKWDEKVRQAKFKSFNSIARTMSVHYQNILNYFDNRSTNASAESFNAKIKAFRAQFRGVRNIKFFLFRDQHKKLWSKLKKKNFDF
ncbi:transposase [Polaribacter sp. Q13]|nr:transposase [Polaribacter sp. Q13]QVY67582.1 transposase [Polaribacter sp. Q13]